MKFHKCGLIPAGLNWSIYFVIYLVFIKLLLKLTITLIQKKPSNCTRQLKDAMPFSIQNGCLIKAQV